MTKSYKLYNTKLSEKEKLRDFEKHNGDSWAVKSAS